MIGRRVHEPFLLQLGEGVGDPDTLALSLDRASQISHRNTVMSTCSSARLTDAMSAAEHSCRVA
jgi:hypothetical protein